MNWGGNPLKARVIIIITRSRTSLVNLKRGTWRSACSRGRRSWRQDCFCSWGTSSPPPWWDLALWGLKTIKQDLRKVTTKEWGAPPGCAKVRVNFKINFYNKNFREGFKNLIRNLCLTFFFILRQYLTVKRCQSALKSMCPQKMQCFSPQK